jgi:mono/diheme cytochrome c family protein
MNRLLRRVLIGLAVLVAVLVGTGFALHVAGSNRLANGSRGPVQAVAIPTDEAALLRGAHLSEVVTGCSGCHLADLGGQVFFEDPIFGRIVATNLTTGEGGFGADASIEDWVRAVRHGVGRDGRVLAIMPSDGFAHLSDADLGAILAYILSAPPVDRVLPDRRLVFPGTAIAGFLMWPDLPTQRIAAMAAPSWPEPSTGAAYGRYLLEIAHCHECHGLGLTGKPANEPGPKGPDLTRSGALSGWTEDDFVHAMRTGVVPGGRTLSIEMPFPYYARMSNEELAAMWAALAELP